MNICFFGASSERIDKSYTDAAYELGQRMAERGHTLVYGGGCGGMMGSVASGAMSRGGRVIGYSPEFFKGQGVLFETEIELHYTPDMRRRKQAMEDNSDAVVMMPGSIGTYEEFFEILTLKQLGQVNKPIAALSVNDYFRELDALIRRAVDERFLSTGHAGLFRILSTADETLDFLEASAAQAADG